MKQTHSPLAPPPLALPKFYLSPSRAWSFHTNIHAFIQNYVFDFPAPVKREWSIGTLAHEMLYKLLKDEPMEECKDKRQWNTLEKQGIFGVYGDLVPLKEELGYFLEYFISKEEKKTLVLEHKMQNDEEGVTGIPDIITSKKVVEVKQTGGDMDNFTKYQSPVRLGIQQCIYSMMFDKMPPLGFLSLEASYPYRVKMIYLPDEWIDDCMELTLKIRKEYFEFMVKLHEILSPINPEWFRDTKNRLFHKKEIYDALVKHKIYKIKMTAEIPIWERQKMDMALGYN